jgi:hypothetical protein
LLEEYLTDELELETLSLDDCVSEDSGASEDDDLTKGCSGYRIGSDVPPSPQATRNRQIQINEKKRANLNINILQKILITKHYSTFFVNSNGIFRTDIG